MLYFGGGPGCSSLLGAFVNNGPCRFDNINQTEPSLNPYSFNAYANLLYVDQPLPTGFSYGNGTQPRSTKEAAVVVYDFLQAFYDQFPEYQERDVGIFTSSYGGHFGPEFTRFILEKNEEAAGHEIKVTALGLDNAWMAPIIQDRANLEYAHKNNYRQLINDTAYESLVQGWEANQKPLIDECAATGADQACHDAWISYNNAGIEIFQNFPDDFKTFDIRPGAQSVPSPEEYLQREDVRKAIGAEMTYDECAWPQGFIDSGDGMTTSISTWLGSISLF